MPPRGTNGIVVPAILWTILAGVLAIIFRPGLGIVATFAAMAGTYCGSRKEWLNDLPAWRHEFADSLGPLIVGAAFSDRCRRGFDRRRNRPRRRFRLGPCHRELKGSGACAPRRRATARRLRLRPASETRWAQRAAQEQILRLLLDFPEPPDESRSEPLWTSIRPRRALTGMVYEGLTSYLQLPA